VTAFPSSLPIIAGAFARLLEPPPPMVPSSWMAENLIVPDGPRAGGKWDPLLAPYVAEIVDCLGPETPHNIVAVRKSAQTGVSVAAIGLTFAYVDMAPAKIGYAVPTIDALQEFNREKLHPSIEGTAVIRSKVRAQTSRSATGSTTGTKSFPGGSLRLINANSAPDLRSKTLKIGVGDEVDEWADDLDGQGDPWDLLKARFISFHATGDWKLLALSTPTIAPNAAGDGGSRIEQLFRAGDQRFWHVECPGCRTPIVLEFKQLTFERKPPHKAYYVAQCCGRPIEHFEKANLVRSGGFVATNPDGLYPSFHVDALISQITTWDKIAEEWVAAEGKERKEKAFHNLWLGLPYEVRGDAPDHVKLMERREVHAENRVPPLALLLVAGADVQHNGIWVQVIGFAPDKQSWTVTARFLEGDTTDPDAGAFAALAQLYNERFEDAFGNRRLIEGIAIDAGDGGRSNQVYAFVQSRPRAYAIKGAPGWGRPALGTPTKVQITLRGKKLKRSAMLWPVGTWDLKAEFYADLRKDGRRAGRELDPPGYCHFGDFLDENFFRQITAEYLKDSKVRGRTVKIWQETGPNHLLDCRVYATAIAEHLGLTRKTREQWLQLAQFYSVPIQASDLFAPEALAVERPAAAAEVETPRDEMARVISSKPQRPGRKRMSFRNLGAALNGNR